MQTLLLAEDCFRFVTGFFDIINKSCMHIYHSALALAPKTSIVWQLYHEYAHPITDIVHGLPGSWDSSIATTNCLPKIFTAAWSPCGTYIATTWKDSPTIEILDPATLARHYTMDSTLEGTRVVAFSPNSCLLSCCGSPIGSSKTFLEIWDIHTGGIVRTKEYEMQIGVHPSSITYSADGEMIGVSYDHTTLETFTICIYNVDTGDCIYSHSFCESFMKIWTHNGSFRFATIDLGAITVWEVELALNSCHKEVESLYAPSNFNPSKPFLFFPPLYRLAYVADGTVVILDAQNGELLLEARDESFKGSEMSFSPDGHLFACGTTGPDIHLWEGSESGYTPHQKFTSSTLSPIPLFSPDKTSIITWDSSMIQLWPLEGPTTPTLMDPPEITGHSEHFILEFSPGESLAVATRGKSNTVTVLDLQLGNQQTIDTGMEVYGLRIVNSTIVVEGRNKLVTWKLPGGDSVPSTTMNINDSIGTTSLKIPRPNRPQSTSISPDLQRIAIRGDAFRVGSAQPLFIHDVLTGRPLAKASADGSMAWFSQDGSQIWCDGEVGREQGWQVVGEHGSTQVNLTPLPVGSPPEGYPWRSSRGYTVTDDGWVLDLRGKRLLWLPPRWRSDERKTRVWSGQFLALLHKTLPEPVVLKFKV